MSGSIEDISLVHWTQKWLENGTLYFHVSLRMKEYTSFSTPPTVQEPVQELDEQLHVLHVSVMVSGILYPVLFHSIVCDIYPNNEWVTHC